MKRILCFIESLGSGGAERQLEVCYFIKKEFYLPYLKENGVNNIFLAEATNPSKRFFALRKHIKTFNPDSVISYSASPSMILCLFKLLGLKFNLIVSERSNTQKNTIREKLRFFLYRWAVFIVPNSQRNN